jgi:hypothetical protein
MEARAVSSLLAARELTPEERAAHDEEPRPGVWAGEPGADLRRLTQDQTDALVRWELWFTASPADRDDVAKMIGQPHAVRLPVAGFEHSGGHLASRPRGGIDSDPFVRLLAYRAWGDRGRRGRARVAHAGPHRGADRSELQLRPPRRTAATQQLGQRRRAPRNVANYCRDTRTWTCAIGNGVCDTLGADRRKT